MTPEAAGKTTLAPEQTVAARDKAGLRSLLTAVHVPDPDIEAIVRTVLNRARRR